MMSCFYKYFYALLILLIFIYSCNGQENKPVIKSGANEMAAIKEVHEPDPYYIPIVGKVHSSLPHTITRNMVEDRKGNIWFATFSGIFKYDGKSFTNISEDIGLAGYRFFSVFEDNAGNLWFGSLMRGVCRYDGLMSRIFNVKDGLTDNAIMCMAQDISGNMWFGTENGTSRFDGKTFTNYTTDDGLIHNSVYSMVVDQAGRLWLGTQGGVCVYDGKTFTNIPNKDGTQFENVRAMKIDKSGNIWFGGKYGACRYDGKNYTYYRQGNKAAGFNNMVLKEDLIVDFVGSMIVDKLGRVWLGHPDPSHGGVSRFEGKYFTHITELEGLCNGNIYCLMESRNGDIWFGTLNKGLCKYDGKTFSKM